MNRVCAVMIVVSVASTLGTMMVTAEETGIAVGHDVTIVINADTELGELYNFWNVFPVTVQAPFKDATRHKELRKIYPHADYINCVRFLGGIKLEKDDYFRGVDSDGRAICDFTEAISLLSGIRQCGFTPWIVLDNVPAAMCDAPTKNRYGNTEPPADFDVWTSYVRQLVRALVDEFGLDEVSRWRFRVGTEPDLKPGHWSGTKEEYFEHYDHTVAAVMSVIPDADIGPGNIFDPAKKRRWSSWGTEIIDHCATGTNYATGGTGTPMRFFASSYYTDVGTSDERFETLVDMIREKLAAYTQFADVPVEIQEFGILSEGGKWIVGDGTHWGGSWMAHMANKIYSSRVPRVYQWAWNTTKGGGIPIPVTHVMGMLEEMVGGKWLVAQASRESEFDDIGCIASRKQGRIDLIIFRHRSVRDDGQSVNARIILKGRSLGDANWSVTRGSIIDHEHAGFVREQKADMEQERTRMGQDANVFAVAMSVMAANRTEYLGMSKLGELEPLPKLVVDDGGSICFDVILSGHSVVNLRLQ